MDLDSMLSFYKMFFFQGMRKINSQQLRSGGLQGLLPPASQFISMIAPYIPFKWESRRQISKEHQTAEFREPESLQQAKHFMSQCLEHLTTALQGKCQVQDPGLKPPGALMADHCWPCHSCPCREPKHSIPCYTHRTFSPTWPPTVISIFSKSDL